MPIVAGAGSNDTQKAIALSKAMRDAGATHLLHTSPMYNKPPQRGIVAHFRAIAEAVDLPIVVYNVPGRTGSNIEAKTTLEMSKIPGIVAVKEASGILSQIADIIRGRAPEFSVLSGDDEITLPVMALGGDGIVSVISNATPKLMSQLCEKMLAGDVARRARDSLHAAAVHARRVRRVESDARQGGAGDDGPASERRAAPARADGATRTPLRVRVRARRGGSDAVRRPLRGAARAESRHSRRRHRASRLPADTRDVIDALLDALERGEVRAAERERGRNVACRTRG